MGTAGSRISQTGNYTFLAINEAGNESRVIPVVVLGKFQLVNMRSV